MLVKIHSRGKGGGNGPVDYLLGKNRDRELATVLRGDTENTKKLIDSLNFARNYTSGVMSFSESDLPDDQKQELMDELEQCLLSGLDSNQYDVLWVEHRDKDRLELNFLIPNVELNTGKRLQPYYDKADKKRKDAFQTIMNDRFNLSDPNDPARARALSYASDLPTDKKKAIEQITNGLMNLIEAGEITNRPEIIDTLKNNGFNVTRDTKQSISIKLPGEARATRFKGAIYEESFTVSRDFRATIEANNERYRKERKQRAQKARDVYQEEIERKSEYNQQRYRSERAEISTKVEPVFKRIQQSIKQSTEQNATDIQHRNDGRHQPSKRVSCFGVQISNNKINDRLNEHERNTETTSIRNQVTRTKTRAATENAGTTIDRISDAIKRLAATVERYATSVIGLSELRRKQRYEDRPSISFRR
jgi:hypothetical protein